MIENTKRESEGLVSLVKYNEDTLDLPMFGFQLLSCFSGLFYECLVFPQRIKRGENQVSQLARLFIA